MIAGFIRETCRVGQGPACCRYVLMGAGGWECAKGMPSIKLLLDQRVANREMVAVSDNCDGVDDLAARQKASAN